MSIFDSSVLTQSHPFTLSSLLSPLSSHSISLSSPHKMSWLVTSLANSLKLDDNDNNSDDDDNHRSTTANSAESSHPNPSNADDQIDNPKGGVKDDLSEFSKTLTRQFWGVASFLAPPPQIDARDQQTDDSDDVSGDLAAITGIRNDLSEIGGRFKTGISKLSTNKAVSEFTKIATNILQFASEEDLSIEEYAQRGVLGMTDEVVSFARDVSMHPETWIDFPLPDDDDDDEDFDLSDAQQEHALAIERLAPELAALRTELCIGYMTEGSFWKIYFVLVHPRLSKEDAAILSTEQIVRARAMLTQELHSRGKSKSYDSMSGKASVDATELAHEEHLSVPVADRSEYIPVEISAGEPAPAPAPSASADADIEIDKHSITSTEVPVVDKAVVGETSRKPAESDESTSSTYKSDGNVKAVAEEVSKNQLDNKSPIPDSSKNIDQKDDEDVDDWLKEESAEGSSYKITTSYEVENDDDVSFSDLEEEDDVPTSYKKAGNTNSSAKGGSSKWIQLNSRSTDSSVDVNTKNKESNDWLDVEDIDDA